MPAQLIAFPFRFGQNGQVMTQLDDTPEYYDSELQVIIGTIPGERQLAPTFGVDDLVFDPYAINTLRAQVEKFGPPVSITDVSLNQDDERTVSIIVEFEPVDDDTADTDYLQGA